VSAAEQLNLGDYANELAEERSRVEDMNRDRRKRRAFIVFATDPDRVGQDDYKLIFACEARSAADAAAKVRARVGEERRVVAYLASGKYHDLLPQAKWVG